MVVNRVLLRQTGNRMFCITNGSPCHDIIYNLSPKKAYFCWYFSLLWFYKLYRVSKSESKSEQLVQTHSQSVWVTFGALKDWKSTIINTENTFYLIRKNHNNVKYELSSENNYFKVRFYWHILLINSFYCFFKQNLISAFFIWVTCNCISYVTLHSLNKLKSFTHFYSHIFVLVIESRRL